MTVDKSGHIPGGGIASKNVNQSAPFVDARPNCFINPHEASSRRGQARATDVAGNSRRQQNGGGGYGGSDVGGR